MIYFISSLAFILMIIICEKNWEDVIGLIFLVLSIFSGVAVLIMTLCVIGNHIDANVTIETTKMEYNSLVYQLENNLYDNDNDIGKKELYNQIQEWNTTLAKNKTLQRDLWLGIFYPNIYDDFNFIKYGGDRK